MREQNEPVQFGLGKVTPLGLLINGRLYSNANMVKNQWFFHSRIYGEWEVPVLFKESDPDSIGLLEIKSVDTATTIVASDLFDIETHAYYETIQALKQELSRQRELYSND